MDIKLKPEGFSLELFVTKKAWYFLFIYVENSIWANEKLYHFPQWKTRWKKL